MSLKQRVLTNNALKALTPKTKTIETSYSKVDTVTTKIKTVEGVQESKVTSVIETTDVCKEQEAVKTYEHRELNEVTTQKSVLDFSESEVVFDKYLSSPYKGPELTDSVFQSDTEESGNTQEIEDNSEQTDVDMKTNEKALRAEQPEVEMEVKTDNDSEINKIMGSDRNETGRDPTFNVYESLQDPPPNETLTKEQTVLTEVPIMSEQQYSAMEENSFDELHEECFNEEIIVQEYLSPSKGIAVSEEREESEPIVSEVIELDSSSSNHSSESDRDNDYQSDDSSAVNSSAETEKIPSESENEAQSSDDEEEKEVLQEAVESDSVDSEQQTSTSSEASQRLETIFEEDTEEVVLVGAKQDERVEVFKPITHCEEYSHLPEAAPKQDSESITSKKEIECVTVDIPGETEKATQQQRLSDDLNVIEHQNQTGPQKSDLEFSLLSDQHMSRTLGDTLYRTDLSYSLETPNETKASKSDLEFSLIPDETSLLTTTSTPFAAGHSSGESFGTQQVTHSTPRRRSKSMDVTPEIVEMRKATLRKRSLSSDCPEDTVEKSKTRKRSLSMMKLPAIPEENKEVKTKDTKQQRQSKKTESSSGILEARRVTRRQKSLLEKVAVAEVFTIHSSRNENSSESEGEERGPALAPLDPLKLLEKQSFKGK